MIIKNINGVVVTADNGELLLNLPPNMNDFYIKAWKKENAKILKELKEKSKSDK